MVHTSVTSHNNCATTVAVCFAHTIYCGLEVDHMEVLTYKHSPRNHHGKVLTFQL